MVIRKAGKVKFLFLFRAGRAILKDSKKPPAGG